MRLSQHFVTVIANTIQPIDYTTLTSVFDFGKPLPTTPFTAPVIGNTYVHPMDTKILPSYSQTTSSIDQEPVVIAVIGHGCIGKSRLIQHGFPHYQSYQYQDITTSANTVAQQHSYVVNISEYSLPRHVTFLETNSQHIVKDNDLTTSVHAALICYDVTQCLSMNGVPDLLNFYHSRQIPTYLLGLHSDSASTRQLDYSLGEQLALHFKVEFYEMKTNNVLNIHHMFITLLRKCASAPVTNNNRTNSPVICQPSSSSSTPPPPPPLLQPPPPSAISTPTDDDTNIKMNFSTTVTEVVNQHLVENNHHHDNNQVRHLHPYDEMPATISASELNAAIPTELDSDDPTTTTTALDNNTICPPTGFVYAPTTASPVVPFELAHEKTFSTSSSRKPSTDNFSKFRRGSKDSGDSLGTGLSVDAIIDRLITPGIGRNDELMIPIFVIFFRKFMSPYELIQVLIKRFENDLCMPTLPTPTQSRIASVLIAWMTDYWCDFHHRQTRNQLHLFLGHLSALVLSTTSSSSLKSLLEKLYPLSLQATPDFDPDDSWGRKDVDTASIDHSKKKDSGYISCYLGASYTSLVPESSTSDIPLGDCVSSRRPSATETPATTIHLERTPSASTSPSPQPPLKRPDNRSSIMTSSAKLCAHSSLVNSPVTPDYFNGFVSSSTPTSRIHATPSTSSPPSPPITNSGSTTPASLTNISKMNDGYQHKSTNNNYKRNGIAAAVTTSPSPSPSSSSNASLTRPEFAGGLTHVISSRAPMTLVSQSNADAAATFCQPMSRSRMCNPLGIPMTSSPSCRPYCPTGFTAPPPPPVLVPSPSVNAPTAGNMHQPAVTQQTTTFLTIQQKSSTANSIDPISVKINTKLLLSLSNQELAEQLTWIETELFGKIKSREFVRMIWASHDTTTKKPQQQTRPNSMASLSSEEQEDLHPVDHGTTNTKSGLLASISHFNFISAWVISMIVTQPKLGKRVALLEKFMTIAVALRDLNNYNSLMAILAGVNNAAVLRMKHTQEAIKKRKIYKRFQSLEKLMSSDRSYSSYRIALKANTSPPSIPYLGIHSQDLIALDEANKDVKADGTIHWDKFRLMGECIMMMIKLQRQQQKHTVMPNQTILNWIANCSILTEEEQYSQSILAEPRLKAKSVTRLRDLWFRV